MSNVRYCRVRRSALTLGERYRMVDIVAKAIIAKAKSMMLTTVLRDATQEERITAR